MTRFVKIWEGFQNSRQLQANCVISRYWHLVEQGRAHQEKEKIKDANKLAAGAPSQPSFMDAVVLPMKPDVRDIAVRRRRFETQDYDHKGVVVVASAWLLVYGLLFGGFAITQAADVLASLN
jgi:hypothetical protein